MIRPPPSSTLFPYPTLFRSRLFLAELLASYTNVASGSTLVKTSRGWPRHRFSELDPMAPPTATGFDERAAAGDLGDRKSTRLNSSHLVISYAVFCLKQNK